jgi:hypothetical protein
LDRSRRTAVSPIIEFYSSFDNIGNFLPVLGIQSMLETTPDTWCMHDRNADFDFINAHYRCAIVGGAGLLHRCFEPFWEILSRECTLPIIIWGVGGCFPGGRTDLAVSRSIVSQVVRRCDLVNVRDEITAEYYSMREARITACPTLVYLQRFSHRAAPNGQSVLFASHMDLVTPEETEEIRRTLKRVCGTYVYTDNMQTPRLGVTDIISKYYCRSRLVVTTRLHGAIISYALGIPYIAIPKDDKVCAFWRHYGNGTLARANDELSDALMPGKVLPMIPIEIAPVLEFGEMARKWVQSTCELPDEVPRVSHGGG